MDTPQKNWFKRHKVLAILLTLILIFFIVGTVDKVGRSARIKEGKQAQLLATQDVEKASVKYIQASLDVYYVSLNQYPTNTETLLGSQSASDKVKVGEAIKELKDFQYSVRGDGQSYKISYTAINGESVAVEGNYRVDYR